MSEKRKALGRGLAALLPGASAPAPPPEPIRAVPAPAREGLRTVAIEEVHPADWQPRTQTTHGSRRMTASIASTFFHCSLRPTAQSQRSVVTSAGFGRTSLSAASPASTSATGRVRSFTSARSSFDSMPYEAVVT